VTAEHIGVVEGIMRRMIMATTTKEGGEGKSPMERKRDNGNETFFSRRTMNVENRNKKQREKIEQPILYGLTKLQN
jgi:hypothetical protein